MTTKTDNQQLAFHAWLSRRGIASNYQGDGQYGEPRVQLAWEAWTTAVDEMRPRAAVEADRQGRMPSYAEIDQIAYEHCDDTDASGEEPRFNRQESIQAFAHDLLSRYGSGQPAASAEPPVYKDDDDFNRNASTAELGAWQRGWDACRAQDAASAGPDIIRDALEAARNGLEWYRDRCPDAVDGSDDEADELIGRALASLDAAPVAQEPVAWPKNAQEIRNFINTNFISRKSGDAPSDDDEYFLTAHDLLSAFDWWADIAPVAAQVDRTTNPQGNPVDESAEMQDREDAEPHEWMTDESRAPWAINSLKARIKEMRASEKRCRNAFRKDYMRVVSVYFADALGEAAGAFEKRLAAIDAARAAKGAAQAQPCNHVFEARPTDGTTRASAQCEPVCRKCGYRPAARSAKGE